MVSSGSGVRARKKALTADTFSDSFLDEARNVVSASTALPKMRFAGTVRSASEETEDFRNGRKPPGLNLIPKTWERPSSRRENLRVWIPETTELSF